MAGRDLGTYILSGADRGTGQRCQGLQDFLTGCFSGAPTLGKGNAPPSRLSLNGSASQVIVTTPPPPTPILWANGIHSDSQLPPPRIWIQEQLLGDFGGTHHLFLGGGVVVVFETGSRCLTHVSLELCSPGWFQTTTALLPQPFR